jgi:hypothetical protein
VSRVPEFTHHSIGGRDFVMDSRYTELKYVLVLEEKKGDEEGEGVFVNTDACASRSVFAMITTSGAFISCRKTHVFY